MLTMSIPIYRARPLDWELALKIWNEYGDPEQLSNFGPLVRKLESRVADLLSVSLDRVVAFASGTDSLAASVSTLEVPASRVALPDFSFIATLRAAKIGFGGNTETKDVDIEDWSMTSNGGSSQVSVPVCVFGASPHYLMRKFSGSWAVIDAAASLGSLPNLSNLEKNHAVCFSMHSTKLFGAGEGGISVFGDKKWAERARAWSNFGKVSHGEVMASGSNGKMSEIQAAFQMSRIAFAKEEIEDWAELQNMAASVSSNLNLNLAPFAFDDPNPYWIVRFPEKEYRDSVKKMLGERGIETKIWWDLSLSLMNGDKELPNSKKLRETTLGLPMFPGMGVRHFQTIESELRSVIRRIGLP